MGGNRNGSVTYYANYLVDDVAKAISGYVRRADIIKPFPDLWAGYFGQFFSFLFLYFINHLPLLWSYALKFMFNE